MSQSDDLILTNTGARNRDVLPWVYGLRKERISLEYGQSLRVSRAQAQNAMNHFGPVLRAQSVADYISEAKAATKCLVLRSQGAGDLLLMTPVFKALAKEYQEVHVGLRSDLRAVLECNPHVTRLWNHTVDGIGDAPLSDPTFLATIDCNLWSEAYDPDRATYHRTLSLAKKCGVKLTDADMEPELYVAQGWLDVGKRMIGRKPGHKYVGIQVVASHSYRDFWAEHSHPPYPKHEELIRAFADAGWTPVIFSHFQKIAKPDRRAIDLQGQLGLDETIGAMNECDAFVGADSGLVHMAAGLGVPVVGMFGICSPQYRMTHYKGVHKELTRVPCIGCGDFAMSRCKQPNQVDGECMRFPVHEVVSAVASLGPRTTQPRIGTKTKKAAEPARRIVNLSTPAPRDEKRGLWMAMMFQDETPEHMQRFVDRVIAHAAIEKVIAVDGGCKTGADAVLRNVGKVEVHPVPYAKGFFNAQAHQRNACFAFVPEGQPCFYFDPDEAFGGDMADWLKEFSHLGIDYCLVARATWDTEDEARSHGYRSPGTHNWPDWQPRFYRWRCSFLFTGGAHHVTLGTPEPTRIQDSVYILHYEEEGGKDKRKERERQWATQMAGLQGMGKCIR